MSRAAARLALWLAVPPIALLAVAMAAQFALGQLAHFAPGGHQ